tara:strand:- start:119 stop:505 length:387 start_codon:yes stop_codon:yes gene_type:complete
MQRHYTKACNFYYGNQSKILVNKRKSIPLHQIKEISFDHVEIITRKSKKKISINQIKQLPKNLKKKINSDIKKIKSKKINFSNFNFKKIPNLLGVLILLLIVFQMEENLIKKVKVLVMLLICIKMEHL